MVTNLPLMTLQGKCGSPWAASSDKGKCHSVEDRLRSVLAAYLVWQGGSCSTLFIHHIDMLIGICSLCGEGRTSADTEVEQVVDERMW